MPAQLIGGVSALEDGSPLCFGYNLGKCDQAAEECTRGKHLCCKKGCHKRHPFINCV